MNPPVRNRDGPSVPSARNPSRSVATSIGRRQHSSSLKVLRSHPILLSSLTLGLTAPVTKHWGKCGSRPSLSLSPLDDKIESEDWVIARLGRLLRVLSLPTPALIEILFLNRYLSPSLLFNPLNTQRKMIPHRPMQYSLTRPPLTLHRARMLGENMHAAALAVAFSWAWSRNTPSRLKSPTKLRRVCITVCWRRGLWGIDGVSKDPKAIGPQPLPLRRTEEGAGSLLLALGYKALIIIILKS
ncbi:hypothetical protein NMY22_g5292 [Coprinellus aureogranulatus]|nr:hypothetical protein NMY22_g5292 [Coprinellus aureogranulatus]